MHIRAHACRCESDPGSYLKRTLPHLRKFTRLLPPKHTRSMALITPQETDQYIKYKLDEKDMSPSPILQFHKWFQEAKDAKVTYPEALSLGTAELPSGRVSVRTVLMKELNSDGQFVVYSNWEHSRKANDFKTNPNVALTFWWKEIERSVRIEGTAQRMTREESQTYYQSRPIGSQIGAWASKQSQPVNSRAELEEEYHKVEKQAEGKDKLECPPFWGGLKVNPERIEFWQGRNSRVHDRVEYTKSGDAWKMQRINP